MINKLRNIVGVPLVKYITMAAAAGALTFYFIYTHQRGSEIVKIDEFKPANSVTSQKGLYVNNHKIPIDKMQPGNQTPLPYGMIDNGTGGLNFFLDDPDLKVEIFRRDKRETLETKLDPTSKGKDGKDGINLQGELSKTYRLKITDSEGKSYEVLITK